MLNFNIQFSRIFFKNYTNSLFAIVNISRAINSIPYQIESHRSKKKKKKEIA